MIMAMAGPGGVPWRFANNANVAVTLLECVPVMADDQ